MTVSKRIGIAIVEQAERYLVGVRGPDGPLAGFAEFPGGKCFPDESPFDCAVRECREESGLDIVPQRLLKQLEFEYPHGRVDLYFVLCHPARLGDVSDRHGEFAWATVSEMRAMRFPDGNAGIIELLADLTSSPRAHQ